MTTAGRRTRRYEDSCEEGHRHESSTALECQHDAAKPAHCGNEKRIGDITDQKVSATGLEIVFQSTKVSIADNSDQRRNDAQDRVRREDCDHEAEVRQATQVSAPDNTGENRETIDP